MRLDPPGHTVARVGVPRTPGRPPPDRERLRFQPGRLLRHRSEHHHRQRRSPLDDLGGLPGTPFGGTAMCRETWNSTLFHYTASLNVASPFDTCFIETQLFMKFRVERTRDIENPVVTICVPHSGPRRGPADDRRAARPPRDTRIWQTCPEGVGDSIAPTEP